MASKAVTRWNDNGTPSYLRVRLIIGKDDVCVLGYKIYNRCAFRKQMMPAVEKRIVLRGLQTEQARSGINVSKE